MKTIKKLFFGMMIIAPLMMIPSQSRAGDLLGDLLGGILGNGGSGNNGGSCSCQTNNPPPPPSNGGGGSVPIDGGTMLLLAAGLALGTKVMYDRSKQQLRTA